MLALSGSYLPIHGNRRGKPKFLDECIVLCLFMPPVRNVVDQRIVPNLHQEEERRSLARGSKIARFLRETGICRQEAGLATETKEGRERGEESAKGR